MKHLIKVIEEHGLKVTHHNKKMLWAKAKGTIIQLNSHELFGLEDDDLMLTIKQKFYRFNIKIDLYNPENNKTLKHKSSNHKKNVIEPYSESITLKKKKIRELLTTKYKLIS